MNTTRAINAAVLLALVGAALLYWRPWRAPPRAQEPVRFEAVAEPAFADPGSLTDAWADVDGDGDPDRFVGFNGAPARLYRNDGVSGFVDVAPALGLALERAVRTAAWGDYDGDGDPDLFLGFAGVSPATALYRNDGPDGFLDVAEELGVALEGGATRQASWVDVDGDDDLDLFLALRDGPNRLWRNDDTGFTDVSAELGLDDPRRSVGAVWLDADQDGDLDLYVANMDGDANGLWRNDGGAFTDVAAEWGLDDGGRALGDEAQGSVRPCAADVDGDGRLDLTTANYGRNGVFLNPGAEGHWRRAYPTVAATAEERFDTCAWGDFDHDGRLDLFVNGTVTGGVQYADHLYRRERADTFVEVTPPELAAVAADHGATWVDYDGDGDLDLALTGVSDAGSHPILENRMRPEFAGFSLQVRVLSRSGARGVPGAEVRVYVAGTRTLLGTRLVDTGSGYDAQSDLPVHVGLRGDDPVDVEVTVPDGRGRRVTVVPNVVPAEHRAGPLEVRVGGGGAPGG